MNLTTMLTTIVEINPDDLIDRLSRDEAKELIKGIDKGQCDVDFTFEMAEWFLKDALGYDDDGKFAKKFKQLIDESRQ